jgi:hypothetical protein
MRFSALRGASRKTPRKLPRGQKAAQRTRIIQNLWFSITENKAFWMRV